MKTFGKVVVVMAALVIFGTLPAYAKKQKGETLQSQPVITAEEAKATLSAAIQKLTLGKPFTKQGRQGDVKLEVPLLLEGKIVAKVRLNPITGEILIKGQKIQAQRLSVSPEEAVKAVQLILPKMQVGSAWLGKNGEWKVPLLYQGVIIVEMGVHGKDGSILPDWKTSKDVTMFGK